MEQELTLGSKVVVIEVDKWPVNAYKRKKQLIGKIGQITEVLTSLDGKMYEVCFGNIYALFYERNLSLDLTLAELYPATDETIRFPEPAIKTPKKSKIKHNRICKRNPRRK